MDERPVRINHWLYPFSLLYGIGVNLRNKLFDWKIFRSKSFNIPVICIGNLTVGGTGKTPHTEYLVSLLKKEYSVAVLSRGYKRRTKGFILADDQSTSSTIGDESYQIKTKFPDIRVAVDSKRVRGISKLLEVDPPVQVILLDDAFQHRYVEAGINILLTDYNRLFCEDTLLPAGRLREPIKGKNRAQMVIVTKCPREIKPIDFNIIAKRLKLFPWQQLYFTRLKYGELVPVFNDVDISKRSLNSLNGKEQILLLTGIVSPEAMEEEIARYNKNIHRVSYGDHHNFSKKDLKRIAKQFNQLSGEKLVITTEKDAARLLSHPDMDKEVKNNLYALPIVVEFLLNQESTFKQNIISYVRKNKGNSNLAEK